MRSTAVLSIALSLACARAGFDAGVEPTFELTRAEARAGATSILLTFAANMPGRVSFAVLDAPQPALDVDALRAQTAGGVGGAVELTDGSGSTHVTGLDEGTDYWIYVLGDEEPEADLRELTVTLDVRHQVDELTATNGARVYYYRYLPEAYFQTDEPFPTLIFLHGLGEAANTDDGTQLDLVLRHGPPALVAAGAELPFVVLSPQCSDGEWNCWGWSTDLVDQVLQDASARYRVDSSRVYLTGLSTGGGGVFNFATNYPNEVAAAIPISSVAVNNTQVIAMAGVPVWAFHCQTDSTQPVTNTTSALAALWTEIQTLDPRPEAPLFTEYPDTCHNAWTRTYDQSAAPYPTTISYDPAVTETPTDIWQWLLAHRRP